MNPSHPHTHTPSETVSSEEVVALLSYMIEHNKHHEEELHALAHNMIPSAKELVHEALADFHRGNDALVKALALLKD